MKPSDRDVFSRAQIFRDVPREVAERLAIGTFVQVLPKGALLFEQGQEAEFLHILLEGRCGLIGLKSDNEECIVEIMQAGDSFIIPAILLDLPYLMSARVLEMSRIAMIPVAIFRRALELEPQLMHAIALYLSHYWRVFVQQIKDLKLRSTNERVAAHLSAMCNRTESGYSVLDINEEFRAIAAKLGMTPESWSRSLRQLEKIGVRSSRHRIEIADVAKLRDFAGVDGLH